MTEAEPSEAGFENPAGWTSVMVVLPVCRKAIVNGALKSPGWNVIVAGVVPTDGVLF